MNRKAAFTFIIMTLVIDAMGIGLIIPVMPDLLIDITGSDLGNVAVWGGVMSTLFAAMQFLVGPTVGSLSDRFGRRPILLISMAVISVDFFIMGLAQSIWLLLLMRLVGGIAAATQSTAAAFIADISSPEEKAANFGILGAAFGVGFVLGPAIGGVIGALDPRAPFFAAAALAALNLCLGFFVLPETVTDAMRRPFDLRRANPIGALDQVHAMPGLGRLLVLFFLYEFAFYVYPAIWAYFTKEQYGWDAQMLGFSLAAFGLSFAFVQGFLIRIVLPYFGERKTLVYGLCFNLFVFVILGLLTNGFIALLFTPISALGAVVAPTLQGMISKRASDNQQGEVQGIFASVRAFAIITAPLAFTGLFFFSTRPDGLIYLPGAPFLAAAVITVLCIILILVNRAAKATQAS